MRHGDLESIRSTILEMRTILGDQAGLPEIRRPGRFPGVKLPIDSATTPATALRGRDRGRGLADAADRRQPAPARDHPLDLFACLVEACVDRPEPGGEARRVESVELLNRVIKASCMMLIRRQQIDGHFPFLDPRGKPSRLAKVGRNAMVAARPDSVKDGWVVVADPAGMAQLETGACGAGPGQGRPGARQARMDRRRRSRPPTGSLEQPCLPHFVANAASASLLSRAYRDGRHERHLKGLVTATDRRPPARPGRERPVDRPGRRRDVEPSSSILRSLHDAWDAIPADRAELRTQTFLAVDRAFASLLDECAVLGVPEPRGAPSATSSATASSSSPRRTPRDSKPRSSTRRP